MTVVLEQVRRWSAAGLDAVVVELDTAGRRLAELRAALARGRPPDAWRGLAGDAARAQHERLVARVERPAAEVSVVRAGVVAAADAVGGVRAGLAEAQALADGSGFAITADGAVAEVALMPAGGGAADARAAVQAEIVDRVEQVLRAAAALDTDLAVLLDAVEAGVGGDLAGLPAAEAAAISGATDAAFGSSTRRISVGAIAITLLAPPDGTPADSAGWWSALSPAARQRVVAEHPEWVGNRDGIPAAVRDEANRALLDGQAGRLDTEIRAAQARYDALTAGGPGTVEAVWLAQRNDLLARLDALHRRREVLDAARTAAAGPDRRVLLLDLDRTHPRAAVAVGDVDTAEHVAVLTPGFGTTVQDGLDAEGETAAALRDRSLSALGGAGRGGETVAAVAWLGYDVPAGAVAVSTPDAARTGGADLARFYDGIDASRRADPHLTALGHSYGSVTTGYALQQAHGVDDAVVFGSPGLGTDHVGDLHVPPGHTGVVEAPWDPVADLGWFGDDPNRLDGVTGLSARPATIVDGSTTAGSVLHADYLTPGTTSQFNIAATVAGLPEERILDAGVGMGDVVRDAVGGRSGS
jgi:Alpha/beta hydrolase